jgi:SAM-dependent methyltransferase
MRELLALPESARILDVPCGWGRHTSLFAEAGHDAHGSDLSTALLARADRTASRGPCYTAADVRALPYADASFDAVVNVFTSLGLFTDDREDVRALREAFRVLVPGGARRGVSLPRREVRSAYAERARGHQPQGTEVRVPRRFDPVSGISREVLRWRRGNARGEKRHALRLRTATDMDRLFRIAGFRERTYYGDWNGERLTHESEHMIVVARRPPA